MNIPIPSHPSGTLDRPSIFLVSLIIYINGYRIGTPGVGVGGYGLLVAGASEGGHGA
jgi:hypothetical protein